MISALRTKMLTPFIVQIIYIYISYILNSLYLRNYFLNSIIIIFIRRDLFKIDPLIAEAKADRIESIKFAMFEENGQCATGTLTKN